ncbi:MAG: hypothetical protein ACMUIS_06140 [bacterium]
MPYRTILVHAVLNLFLVILFVGICPLNPAGADQVGELICGSERDQQAPAIAFADEDSYLIVWQDFRTGSSFDLYGAGAYDGEAFGPFPICTVSRDQKEPAVAWDGVHYVVVWQDNRGGNFYDIYGVRIALSGALLDGTASSGGIRICVAPKDQLHPDLVWNDKDYFLVVWEDYRSGEADIYGTRMDRDLMIYDGPAEDGGLVLCQKAGEQKAPSVAWNGSHYLVVWEDHASAQETDIRGLRVSSVGNILDDVWGGGIAISQGQDMQLNPDVASDGEGFLVVWDKHAPDQLYPDIYGITVSKEGQVNQGDPVAISTAKWNQVNPAVFWTENNYVCLWKDDRDGMVDVYWTRVNRTGGLLNGNATDGGIAINSPLASCIYTPPGGAFFHAKGMVAWEENYTGQLDLYALDLIPPVPPMIEWAGEEGYESDGVDPDKGFGGMAFTFRVRYIDNEGTPPQTAQVWVDLNGDGAFSFPGDRKVDMALAPEETDPNYAAGAVFQCQSAIDYMGEGTVAYRFFFKDDIDEATGPPAAPSSVTVENNQPVLSWCKKNGYYTDGVDPNQAEGSYTFVFRINYRDAEGDLPEVGEVWVDLDDSGTYEQRERFVMAEEDQNAITTGRNFKKNIKILYVGDGIIQYRFLFTDGFHLAVGDPNQGDPTKNHALTVLPHLMAPILSWPVDEEFQDGFKQGSGDEENLFIFKVGYRDPDNDPPITRQVWLDLNGDGLYKEDERFNMSAENSLDMDFTTVNLYTLQKVISYSGEGEMIYKFVFDDGCNIATGDPFLAGGMIMVQSPISLRWLISEGFVDDGVDPDEGPPGTSFEFKVVYMNQYGYPPNVKEVWLDEDLDGEFEDDERYVMQDANPADMDYVDGKEYIRAVSYNGTEIGFIPYRFVFSDIYMSATGPPSQEGLGILILPGSAGDGQQGTVDGDQTTWEGIDMKGATCFIHTLRCEAPVAVRHMTEMERIRRNPDLSYIGIWFMVLKCGLLTLLIMALICFAMFGYSMLRGSSSMQHRL